MIHSQKTEIRRLILLVIFFAVAGYLFDLPGEFIAISFAVYTIWTLYQLNLTVRWLSAQTLDDPPESVGLWGEVFDGIHDLLKRNRKERERLQRSIDHLRSSLAALSDGVVMVDQDGDIEWCNQAAERLLGLRHNKDEHQPLVNLLRAPEFIEYFEEENYGEPLELSSPVKSELTLQVEITFFGKRNRLLFARDVTKLRQVAEMRKDFIANVSHELRTPLTVINGYLETFNEMTDLFPKSVQIGIDNMVSQSHRMENLVKDLILLTKLESIPNETGKPVAIEPMMQTIAESARHATKPQRKVSLSGDKDLAIRGDADELHSALSNIVYNAVRYTNDDGEVTIHWWQDDKGIHIAVKDNGIGIAPEHIPRLTERFYRVDKSRSVNTGGTGLGLAIVKHVLLRHEAELEIRSKIGKGSEFICHFSSARCVPALPSTLREVG